MAEALIKKNTMISEHTFFRTDIQNYPPKPFVFIN